MEFRSYYHLSQRRPPKIVGTDSFYPTFERLDVKFYSRARIESDLKQIDFDLLGR